MRLIKFKIDKYKCIDDSKWIEVSELTVIVGKNEAGKTTLLKGLHKLNPFNKEPYKMDREWPRSKRNERDVKQIVCTAVFELSDTDINEITTIAGQSIFSKLIEVTRNYADEFVIGTKDIFKDELAPELSKSVTDFIKMNLPTFIYMSDYKIFNGAALLDQVWHRKQSNQQTEEDKTLLTILDLSGLTIQDEVTKGNSPDTSVREQRQYDLDDASATLTRTISERWNQKKYEVKFSADGQHFFTFVKDEKDPALIRLEERSKGFQWFFSFDLMFMYESKGSFKNCVILLDEPGLHLHPDGQRDLLKRLENYSKDNTLIYSTHLPFMIDLQNPEGIRVITESSAGSFVTEELTNSQPESKFVLQAALGMSGASSYLLSYKNLVVEGVDDFWFITALSNLFERSNEESLNDEIFITSAGGASEAVYISTFMIGQKLQAYTLLDGDSAGNEAKEKLLKKWLTKYNDTKSSVDTLNEVLEVKENDFAIEDIFTEDYYLSKVKQAYKSQLLATDTKTIKLKGSDLLVNKVERALKDLGISFNKGSVAKLIRKDINQMKASVELADTTRKAAQKIISHINKKLS
ncbi:MAG TPA: ATP-binding protein [Hanamia sp.]|nr:ATP-binding protein [Hanamia sp.]